MPDFLSYYKSLTKRQKKLLNDKIKAEAGISYPTIWRKMNEGTFGILERKAIAGILEQPEEALFPEKTLTELLPKF